MLYSQGSLAARDWVSRVLVPRLIPILEMSLNNDMSSIGSNLRTRTRGWECMRQAKKRDAGNIFGGWGSEDVKFNVFCTKDLNRLIFSLLAVSGRIYCACNPPKNCSIIDLWKNAGNSSTAPRYPLSNEPFHDFVYQEGSLFVSATFMFQVYCPITTRSFKRSVNAFSETILSKG